MKQFDTVPIKVPAKNVFNLSHDVKSSYNFDKLYPFLCQPIYPGDTFNCKAEVFLRTMPLLAPVMHSVDMHLYFFFVPNRLVWNENKKRDWKTFITGGEDGLQNPPLPYFTYHDLQQNYFDALRHGSLLDHMGFPTIEDGSEARTGMMDHINVLPFRAYQLVYNEYFRNQNVQNEIEFSYDQGHIPSSDIHKLFEFRRKCYEKDYFTSCLPFCQRGEAVRLPISFDSNNATGTVSAPVSVSSGKKVGDNFAGMLAAYSATSSGNGRTSIALTTGTLAAGDAVVLEGTATINRNDLSFSGLAVGTINDFRYCLRLQQWLENNARCGSRYIEQLLSHFGVVSSDARLQRPELLGGGKIPLLFSDVAQTSYGDGTSDNVVGDLAGKGTLYGKTSGFKKYFEEHGILLGICCIIPRTSYSQGIPRAWSAMDKTDFYFPEFAHLGEQAVLNKEVYYEMKNQPTVEHGPDDVFGYQGRFTELRYIPSSVHGDMRNTLQYWHFGRIFNSLPALNSEFVEAHTRADVWALKDISDWNYDPFVCQMHLDIKAVRPLPEFSVPTL